MSDHGTGKTSFCQYFAYLQAKKHLKDPTSAKIPIFLTLKDYTKSLNMRQLITDYLINEHGIENARYSTFNRFMELGKILFILDGFDEMAVRVTQDVTLDNLEAITELAIGQSKIILTSRKACFLTREHEKMFLRKDVNQIMADVFKRINYEIVYIEPFNKK